MKISLLKLIWNEAMNELSRPARIRFDVLNENHNAL